MDKMYNKMTPKEKKKEKFTYAVKLGITIVAAVIALQAIIVLVIFAFKSF